MHFLSDYVSYVAVAGLAQLVEQRIRNAWVGSSSLLTGTIVKKNALFLSVFLYNNLTENPDFNRGLLINLRNKAILDFQQSL